MMRRLIVISLLASKPAWAHTPDELVTPSDIWKAWTFEPAVVVLLVLSGLVYLLGLRNSCGHSATPLQKWSFALGWLTLAISQVSPLHELGSVLFSAHMLQHELLMLVAAPLLVYSRPLATFVWALPETWRGPCVSFARWKPFASSWKLITLPFIAWTLHAAAIWIWHLPALYQASVENEWMHALQHASFLVSALLFWWALIHQQHVRSYGASVAYVFTTAVHTSALGVLLTFSNEVWYPVYAGRSSLWGFSVLEDQQLGGLIMWVPAGLVYVAIALWMMTKWLQESERRVLLSSTHG